MPDVKSFRAHPSALFEIRQFVRDRSAAAALSEHITNDLLLAVFYGPEEYGRLAAARPIKTEYGVGGTPLLALIKELAARPHITSVKLIQERRPR